MWMSPVEVRSTIDVDGPTSWSLRPDGNDTELQKLAVVSSTIAYAASANKGSRFASMTCNRYR